MATILEQYLQLKSATGEQDIRNNCSKASGGDS